MDCWIAVSCACANSSHNSNDDESSNDETYVESSEDESISKGSKTLHSTDIFFMK